MTGPGCDKRAGDVSQPSFVCFFLSFFSFFDLSFFYSALPPPGPFSGLRPCPRCPCPDHRSEVSHPGSPGTARRRIRLGARAAALQRVLDAAWAGWCDRPQVQEGVMSRTPGDGNAEGLIGDRGGGNGCHGERLPTRVVYILAFLTPTRWETT